MQYQQVANFGASYNNSNPVFNNDPLTMCIGNNPAQRFNHGGNVDSYGQDSEPCQAYLSQRCAKTWDMPCEIASRQTDRAVASVGDGSMMAGFNSGDLMLRNTAMEKYRVSMRSSSDSTQQCQVKSEPFNTLIPASPILTRYVGDCIGEYAVDPETIESDPVMNKILNKPNAFVSLLNNIRETMIRNGSFGRLAGTRLGAYYGLYSGSVPVIRQQVLPIIQRPSVVAIRNVPIYRTRPRFFLPPMYRYPYPRRDDIHIHDRHRHRDDHNHRRNGSN